jgi:aquaporin Z
MSYARNFVAEFVGTFALVFIGGGAIAAVASTQMAGGLIAVALAHGIILAVLVSATMRVSGGQLNPAITLSLLATRKISGAVAGVHVAAQLSAATLAAWALKVLLPVSITSATRLGGQSVSLEISTSQAIGLEAIATFFLAFVIFGTAVDAKAPKLGGLAIGATIAADILAIGPFTGASMNPARSFGPALMSGVFEGHVIYWIGPLLGAMAAAVLYDWFFIRRAPAAG